MAVRGYPRQLHPNLPRDARFAAGASALPGEAEESDVSSSDEDVYPWRAPTYLGDVGEQNPDAARSRGKLAAQVGREKSTLVPVQAPNFAQHVIWHHGRPVQVDVPGRSFCRTSSTVSQTATSTDGGAAHTPQGPARPDGALCKEPFAGLVDSKEERHAVPPKTDACGSQESLALAKKKTQALWLPEERLAEGGPSQQDKEERHAVPAKADARGSQDSLALDRKKTQAPRLQLPEERLAEEGPSQHDKASDGNKHSSELASVGSLLHGIGKCRPCFYTRAKNGCRFGSACAFCHEPHPKPKKPRPSKHVRIDWQHTAKAVYVEMAGAGLQQAEASLWQRSQNGTADDASIQYGITVLRALFRGQSEATGMASSSSSSSSSSFDAEASSSAREATDRAAGSGQTG